MSVVEITLDETPAYRRGIETTATTLESTLGDMSPLVNTSWVITGGTGQLGAATVNLLDTLSQRNGLGLRIIVAARHEDRYRRRFSDDTQSRIKFHRYETGRHFSLSGIDYVIHAAGYGDPRSMSTDPVGILQTNIGGLQLLLQEFVNASPGRLVYISSGEVYGRPTAGLESFEECYSGPVDTMETRSCYPTAKRAGEALCRAYFAQYGVESVVARQCHVYGPGFSPRDSRVAASFAKDAADGNQVVMKSAGAQVRSWCHELDAASAYVLLAVRGLAGEAYNIAPKEMASISDLAKLFATESGTQVVFENPNNEERSIFTKIHRAVLDSRKIRTLGWHEALNLSDGISLTVQSLRAISRGRVMP